MSKFTKLDLPHTFNSARDICDFLGREYKDSTNSRRATEKELSRYCEWHKDKRKYIITQVFDKPLPKDDGRKNNGGARNIKHGLSNHRLYSIWSGMKDRCYNDTNPNYIYYGARGIVVSDEWLHDNEGFINFYNWSKNNGYSDDLTIDRKNNDGNYEPNNCRWATMKEQANNKRNNIKIKNKECEFEGVSRFELIKYIKELEERLKISS